MRLKESLDDTIKEKPAVGERATAMTNQGAYVGRKVR